MSKDLDKRIQVIPDLEYWKKLINIVLYDAFPTSGKIQYKNRYNLEESTLIKSTYSTVFKTNKYQNTSCGSCNETMIRNLVWAFYQHCSYYGWKKEDFIIQPEPEKTIEIIEEPQVLEEDKVVPKKNKKKK